MRSYCISALQLSLSAASFLPAASSQVVTLIRGHALVLADRDVR